MRIFIAVLILLISVFYIERIVVVDLLYSFHRTGKDSDKDFFFAWLTLFHSMIVLVMDFVIGCMQLYLACLFGKPPKQA